MNVLTCFNTILFDGTLADVHSPMAISGSLEFYSIPPLEQLDEVQEVRPLAVPLGNHFDVGHYGNWDSSPLTLMHHKSSDSLIGWYESLL